MKAVLLTLPPIIAGLFLACSQVQAQVIFGQTTSSQAIPFHTLFVPSTSSASTHFFPPPGFYHYFWLPQYSSAYGRLYTDFQYGLPPGEMDYEFTIIQSFQY